MKKMSTHPPIDFLMAGLIKKNAPKPMKEAVRGAGLPVRKGRVRKYHGNISR